MAWGSAATSPATAGSILRASTSTEIAHILARLEHRRRRHFPQVSHLAVDVCEVSLHPANAGHFDFAIRVDPENARDIGQPVCVRNRVGFAIIEENRKSHAKFYRESRGVLGIVLRNTDDSSAFMPIRPFQSLQK